MRGGSDVERLDADVVRTVGSGGSLVDPRAVAVNVALLLLADELKSVDGVDPALDRYEIAAVVFGLNGDGEFLALADLYDRLKIVGLVADVLLGEGLLGGENAGIGTVQFILPPRA